MAGLDWQLYCRRSRPPIEQVVGPLVGGTWNGRAQWQGRAERECMPSSVTTKGHAILCQAGSRRQGFRDRSSPRRPATPTTLPPTLGLEAGKGRAQVG